MTLRARIAILLFMTIHLMAIAAGLMLIVLRPDFVERAGVSLILWVAGAGLIFIAALSWVQAGRLEALALKNMQKAKEGPNAT